MNSKKQALERMKADRGPEITSEQRLHTWFNFIGPESEKEESPPHDEIEREEGNVNPRQ